MSAILGTQAYKCYFNQGGVNSKGACAGPSSGTQGGITAAMPAGSWVGALVSGYLSDIFGRKKSIVSKSMGKGVTRLTWGRRGVSPTPSPFTTF